MEDQTYSIKEPSLPENRFNQAIEQGLKYAELALKTRYEQDSNPENNLHYHRRKHSLETVPNHAEKILITLQEIDPSLVSDRDIKLARLIIAFHDMRQDWRPEERKNDKGEVVAVMRKRYTGDIERASFEELAEFMRKTNEQEQTVIFTDRDFEIGEEAIMATVPAYDPELGITQPNLRPDGSIIAAVVAAADLDGCGLDKFEDFIEGDNEIFWEENLDIARIKDFSNLGDKEKENIKNRVIAGGKFLLLLIDGRMKLLDQQLCAIPPEPRKILVDRVFTHFESNRKEAEKRLFELKDASFEEVMAQKGYFSKN